jgi:hypothetical protein
VVADDAALQFVMGHAHGPERWVQFAHCADAKEYTDA